MGRIVIKYKGKKQYIHGYGKNYYLSPNKKGALDHVPEGFEIKRNEKSGQPEVRRK